MQSSRLPLFVVFLLSLAAAGFWLWSGADAAAPAPSLQGQAQGTATEPPGQPEAGAGGEAEIARAAAGELKDAGLQRTAVPVSAPDSNLPAIVGRIVDPGGASLANVRVVVGPGMSMTGASGTFDFANLDPADLDDVGPERMMSLAKQGISERVETVTDAEGRFRVVPRGPSRRFGLRALARGFAALDRQVVRPVDTDVDAGTMRLQQGCIVSGRVVDPTGNAIASAVVSRLLDIERTPMGNFDIEMPEMEAWEQLRFGETCRTDAQGRFEFLHMPPGPFSLRARHQQHPTTRQNDLVATAGVALANLTITMARGAEIRGIVVGLPASGVTLRVVAAPKPNAAAEPSGPMGMFGADLSEMLGDMGMPFGERSADIAAGGEFVLRGLRRDNYRIWISQVGVGFAGSMVCSERKEVPADSHGVQLRYEPGVQVTFTVVDAVTSQPIETLSVRDRLLGGDGFAEMMAANMPRNSRQRDYPGGAVTIANLRPKAKQTLSLSLESVGYASFEQKGITLPQSGVLQLGTLRLSPTPTVQVTVIAADTGVAVEGARVRIDEEREGDSSPMSRFGRAALAGGGTRSGRTDEDGRCLLNAPVDAVAFVKVENDQHAPFVSDSIRFPAAGRTDTTARLLNGGRIVVTVVDAQGKPIGDTQVEHRDPRRRTDSKKTDGQGVARFAHLTPGSHDFRLGSGAGGFGGMLAAAMAERNGGDDRPWDSVAVEDKGEATLKITKLPTARLTGVVRENGLPLVGARVAFVEARGSDDLQMAERMFGGMLEAIPGAGGGGNRSAKTDDAGAFQLKELPDGEHRLRITHKERAMPSVVTIQLQNGDNQHDVELDMTTLRGVVRDPDGSPVAGARLQVRRDRGEEAARDEIENAAAGAMAAMGLGAAGGIKTEFDGTFALRGIDPDVALVVQATAKGFAPAETPATVSRGATSVMVELRLGLAGRIKVTCQDSSMLMARATFVGDGKKPPPVMQMLRKGKGTLDGLTPGTWEVVINGMGGSGDEPKRTVEVVGGQTVEVDF